MNETTAVILCGGRGERLKPFTDHVPKPLVPLNGQPLLRHLTNHLFRFGIHHFVFCTGYKAEALEAFVNEGFPEGCTAVCSNTGEDAGMTHRLKSAALHVPAKAIVCYGDTVANVDIAALSQTHTASGAIATMTVHALQSPFGIVRFDELGRVNAFEEKPQLPYWINIGYLLCESGFLDTITPAQEDMPQLLKRLADGNELGAYMHKGKHLTVNTEKEREQADIEVIDIFTMP